MIGESFTFPTAGDEAAKTMAIGGVLTFLAAFVFLTVLPVYGYLVRVLRAAATDAEEPPAFDDWETLFVDGLKVLVVGLVYVGIPSVVLAFGFLFLFGGALAAGEGGLAAGLGLLALLFALVMALVLLVALYLLPAALANFAYHDDLGAAFDVDAIVSGAASGEYVVAMVVATVVYAVLAPIGSIFLLVIVGAFVLFWVQVVATHMVGRGFAAGSGLGDADSTGQDPAAAPTLD